MFVDIWRSIDDNDYDGIVFSRHEESSATSPPTYNDSVEVDEKQSKKKKKKTKTKKSTTTTTTTTTTTQNAYSDEEGNVVVEVEECYCS